MQTITLTRGMVTVVDDDIYEWASRLKWRAGSGSAGRWYAARGAWANGRQTMVYLHRLIAKPAQGEEVDHVNGDSVDNRNSNLRCVTHKQNQENVRVGHGACAARGVTRLPSGRYKAQASVRGKHLTFGTFATASEAAEAARAGRLAAMTHSDGR